MAYIGRERAVVDTRNVLTEDLPGGKNTTEHFNPKGKAGFLVWRSAYWTKAVSTSNKILIPMYWFKSYFFGRDISRF